MLYTTNIRLISLVVVLLSTFSMSGCSLLKVPEPIERVKIVKVNNCLEFQKVVIPKFKNEKIKMVWGVNRKGYVVNLQSEILMSILRRDKEMSLYIKSIYKNINDYNKIVGGQDANSSIK